MAAGAEVDQCAGQAVGAERRVAIDEGDGAAGFGLEEEAAGDDRVATDVVQSAATDRGHVADVDRVVVEVREEHLHRAQGSDLALPHELSRAQPLRMETNHEGFHDEDLAGHGAQALGLRRCQRDRLLAQHMLARCGGLQRQWHVEMVRQRVVDGLDLRIGQQLLIRAVCFRNTERIRGLTGGFRRARGDRPNLEQFALLHAGQHSLQSDLRGADDTPGDFLHGKQASQHD